MSRDKNTIVIYLGATRYDTLNIFAKELGKYFQKTGYKVVYVDMREGCEEIMHSLIGNNSIKFILDFNGRTSEVSCVDESLYNNRLNAPYVAWFVDSPIHHVDRLKSNIEQYYALFMDRMHVDFSNKYFSRLTKTAYLPLAGYGHYSDTVAKDKDIVFLGSYGNYKDVQEQINNINNEDVVALCYLVMDKMVNDMDISIESCIEQVWQENEVKCSDDVRDYIFSVFGLVDIFIRNLNRGRVINILINAGIDVHVYGAGWDKFSVTEDNAKYLHIHGNVDLEQTEEIMKSARIVLNVMPGFKDGSHDRILSAMLAKSVCLTDKSKYLMEEFKDGEDIAFYSLSELTKLPDIVRDLLSDEERFKEIAENGYKKAVENHTWEKRAQQILEFVG